MSYEIAAIDISGLRAMAVPTGHAGRVDDRILVMNTNTGVDQLLRTEHSSTPPEKPGSVCVPNKVKEALVVETRFIFPQNLNFQRNLGTGGSSASETEIQE